MHQKLPVTTHASEIACDHPCIRNNIYECVHICMHSVGNTYACIYASMSGSRTNYDLCVCVRACVRACNRALLDFCCQWCCLLSCVMVVQLYRMPQLTHAVLTPGRSRLHLSPAVQSRLFVHSLCQVKFPQTTLFVTCVQVYRRT